MNFLIKIIIILSFIFSSYTDIVYADTINTNLNVWWNNWVNNVVNNNTHLNDIKDTDTDYTVWVWWDRWIFNLLLNIARDLKNIFFVFSWLFFLILVLKLLISEKTEEEVTNFKKWIIWISIWIIITQIAYYFVSVLFDKNINTELATNLFDEILYPLIKVLQTATSFIFIAIMIYAFFRIITSNWDEEKAKTWIKSVFYALIWFLVVKLSYSLVDTIYWKTNCTWIYQTNCINNTNIWWFIWIIVDLINWMNWFIWIIIIIMIIYTGFLLITSAWDEEKLKKVKNIIIYIIIWIFILVMSYLILTFFLIPETNIW